MPTIGLVMIVKNEAAVIGRCLESIKPYISHWTICDTGSTDGMPKIIERALAGIPGKLFRDEWVNFAHNRTLAMVRAKGTADYHLLLDADMVLRVEGNVGVRIAEGGLGKSEGDLVAKGAASAKATEGSGKEFLTADGTDGPGLGIGSGGVNISLTIPLGEEPNPALTTDCADLRRFPERLNDDAYLIRFEGAVDYSVIRLVSDRHQWRYVGVTHEYIHSDTAGPPCKLPGVSVVHYEDGGSRSDKYERDVRLLTADLDRDPNNARTVFYLAQSYRDSKQFEKALDFYEKRVLMGGWEEETWNALFQLGRIQQILGHDWRVVLNSYLQAYNFRPSRLESVYQIARFYREHQQWSLGYHFARLCTEVGYPEDLLFVERPVYEYLLPFEYAVCCHHTGRGEEARRVADILAGQASTPAELAKTLRTLATATALS